MLSQEGVTQGDPLSMAMYAISTIPLITKLSHDNIKQIWYADDASAGGGDLQSILTWCIQHGPGYGYYPNAAKSWLIVKEAKLSEASLKFSGSGISITTSGQCFLGAAIGTEAFVKSFVRKMVSEWVTEVKQLSEISITQPHSA